MVGLSGTHFTPSPELAYYPFFTLVSKPWAASASLSHSSSVSCHSRFSARVLSAPLSPSLAPPLPRLFVELTPPPLRSPVLFLLVIISPLAGLAALPPISSRASEAAAEGTRGSSAAAAVRGLKG